MNSYQYSWFGEKAQAFSLLTPSEKRVVLGVCGLLLLAIAIGATMVLRFMMKPEGDYGVAGSVSFRGKPVLEGEIVFEPKDRSRGSSRSALISDGQFQLARSAGLRRGIDYSVSIKGFEKTGKKYENADPSLSGDEVIQVIPEQFNAKTTLGFEATRKNLGQSLNDELR